ncbi:MAG: PIN domain-containing protein [Gammaproteobacteria bacterium]|nr:PIN domain-containing protein [Gammaproteobacteria bacterium]MCW8839763.1 PIN domain-containing protein [Gammaproteobacteria bacterium]MCW8957511.1 PIN domain-containing protein [Gammaproteobacteria bacterium]MCW8973423.1 PIN domain-containing protein [Gammaproteobacteria bacterium]MCW8992263.1 PIN domain-containing protein [Gammaproteobacteria bacterium]
MILIDLNVILDVVQRRKPHYRASAAVLDEVVSERVSATLPAHAVTTLHYLVSRYNNRRAADKVVDWLLRYFAVAETGKSDFIRAMGLSWQDYEDAVVAIAADVRGCSCIVTRNVKDFTGSPVPALTPEEFLLTQTR